MTDIKLVSTPDLVAELVTRCAPAIFIGYKDEGPEGMQVFNNYAGHPSACFGLCHQMALNIQMREIVKIREGDNGG